MSLRGKCLVGVDERTGQAMAAIEEVEQKLVLLGIAGGEDCRVAFAAMGRIQATLHEEVALQRLVDGPPEISLF